MLRVDHRNAFHVYVARTGDFHAAQGLKQHPASHNPHILRPVHPEFGFHQSSRCQIDRAVARYVYLTVGQILGLMYAGTEINQTAIFPENIFRTAVPNHDAFALRPVIRLRLHRIGKQMEIAHAVAPELHTQLGRTLQAKRQGVLAHLII